MTWSIFGFSFWWKPYPRFARLFTALKKLSLTFGLFKCSMLRICSCGSVDEELLELLCFTETGVVPLAWLSPILFWSGSYFWEGKAEFTTVTPSFWMMYSVSLKPEVELNSLISAGTFFFPWVRNFLLKALGLVSNAKMIALERLLLFKTVISSYFGKILKN